MVRLVCRRVQIQTLAFQAKSSQVEDAGIEQDNLSIWRQPESLVRADDNERDGSEV